MTKTIRVLAAVLLMTAGGLRVEAAAIIVFLTPANLSGGEHLIQFDELGVSPNSSFRSGVGVGFKLLEGGTLTDTGFGPTMASAPNSTFSREFAPQTGPFFLNTINFNAFDVDLAIDFPTVVTRAAAEIRSGQTGNDARDLSFELYRAGLLVGQTTVPIRGQNNFFFYGLQQSDGFDRWIIRQRPDDRFDLENLRFEFAQIPEPGTMLLTVAALVLMLAGGRCTPQARREADTPGGE